MQPGDVIAGFRIRRAIGDGSGGQIHEAIQLSLGRTVALRLLDIDDFSNPGRKAGFLADQRVAASIHHPAIVPTYEAGEWEGGRFIATRFVRGATLAEALDRREVTTEQGARLVSALESGLDTAHAVGLVHGAVAAHNVLIDDGGVGLLTDLGLGRPGSAEQDLAALAELRAEIERRAVRRRPRYLAPVAAGLAVIAAAVLVLTLTGEDSLDPASAASPPTAPGAEAIGSGLEPGAASSLGCSATPGPNTPVCTVGQASVSGSEATVGEDGVIRGWAVRNAMGDLTLQVIGRAKGRTELRGFSATEFIPDRGPHAFAANIPVSRGDLVGVVLGPGATIGARASGAGTAAVRWEGTLPYSPLAIDSITVPDELLLRVDVEVGGEPDLLQLSGASAASAKSGAVVDSQIVQTPGGGHLKLDLARVDDGVVVDSVRKGRRLARIDVSGADASGALVLFESTCGYIHGFCLRWQNEDSQAPVIHAYRLTSTGGFRLIG